MWEIWTGSGKSEQTMQGMYICFVFIALLKSAATLKVSEISWWVCLWGCVHVCEWEERNKKKRKIKSRGY